ncbi:MAG: hypothetical protein KAJ01_02525 [Candidatus Hydrogenedentes bacterium]|jgi:hypothetical protein|nr:hypothetical protein [Candidatus Hydrogenedentota bacterium]
MARRKKRFTARHPEKFQQLDEELSRALDNLAERNKETEASLGRFGSAETDSDSPDAPQQTTGERTEGETAQ